MNAKNIVAVVQARMSSSRFPGKVLEDLAGEPVIGWVVRRARRARTISDVAIATTVDPSDDRIAEYCQQNGIPCYRGSMFDVLDRYYQAACLFKAEIIVRLTADCPLIDPDVIDLTVNGLLKSNPPADLVVNRFVDDRTYPIGLDTEVCTFQALERAWKEATRPHEREHVLPYIYETEGEFRVLHVKNDVDYGQLRWTVDTPEDLELVRAICANFPGRNDFSWLDVLHLVEQKPELSQLNAGIRHKHIHEVDDRAKNIQS